MCHVRRRFCMLRTGVLQDRIVARTLLPCAVSNRVVRDLSLASSGESLRGGWFSQPSRGANSIFSRRAALVAHARTSGSRDLSLPHLPSVSSSRTTRILTATLVLCLHHSLGLYIAYSIRFLPSITAAASIRPAINHQSINRTPTL
jgi:hypothetical protein